MKFMINRELSVCFGNKQVRVFMQDGFLIHEGTMSSLHKHRLTEVQILLSGNGELITADEVVRVSKNDMVIIPHNTYHRRNAFDDNASILTFLTTFETSYVKKVALEDWLINKLVYCSEQFLAAGDSVKLSLYIGILLSEFDEKADISVPIQDRKLLIDEFFSRNYSKDVLLSDLANTLNLSEKQTERLVIKYMGGTFKKVLAKYRIEMALAIMNHEDIPLMKLSERVGYKSYSGFWKAYNNEIKNRR
jgi:AraC-like DNA-binding protein/quercetin dioxygenase-like cupin family protein